MLLATPVTAVDSGNLAFLDQSDDPAASAAICRVEVGRGMSCALWFEIPIPRTARSKNQLSRFPTFFHIGGSKGINRPLVGLIGMYPIGCGFP